MLVGSLHSFLIYNMTFIALNLHQNTDSKVQQPRNKAKELNGRGVLRLFTGAVNVLTLSSSNLFSWEGRGNQYIQLFKVLYCILLANGKKLPAFPLEVGP